VEGKLLSNKWLNINGGVACKRIINCSNVADLEHPAIYSHKTTCRLNGRMQIAAHTWKLGNGE
jgi:hypothetical protein